MEEILPQVHELKIWPAYFDAIINGSKTYELRKNDRPYMVGDTLHLREYYQPEDHYTGREMRVLVTDFNSISPAITSGYCLMSIRMLSDESTRDRATDE